MTLRSTAAAVFLLAALSSSSFAQRLPSNIHPEHYALHFTPDLKAATFTGEETIDVILDAPSATVTLNAIELRIPSVTANGQTAQVSFDAEKQQATFTFAQPLPAGKNTLNVTFAGILNDKLRGFYLSKTKARSYAVTQFESTDARRAFPCFDEPAMKATYDISLTVDKNDTVISNGKQKKDKGASAINGVEKHTVTFDTTPKMSTYLVAFLVGDFQCSKGKADGTPIRVCSVPDKVKLTQFALDEAKRTLHFYNNYFGIKYPMPKLDMVAIPDFEAGAMENFGCITYRETGLLVDKKLGSTDAKKTVLTDVTHEMAHQWFGDMVTMQWWDNLWLNEGFATWMSSKAANVLHPEWGFTLDDASTLDGTLATDSSLTTRAIRATADTPAQINEMFDGITYEKGGAVIGMVENFVGPEVFQQGVHNYLAAHLYANATAEDFWNAQTANSHHPVDRIMQSFIAQPGVPLVQLGEGAGGSLTVAQQRFFATALRPELPAQQWTLPLCFKTATNPQCTLVSPETRELTPPAGATTPLYANAASKGFFRTQYSPAQTVALIASVQTRLTPEERIAFVGDRWALMEAGQGSVGDYLDLAFALKNDANADVLANALGKLISIEQRIGTQEDNTKLHAIMRREFTPVYKALGPHTKDETQEHMQRRTLYFNLLGHAEDPDVEDLAMKNTVALFTGKGDVDPALTDVSVSLSARHGNTVFYDAMQRVSKNTDNPALAEETLDMLAQFEDPQLVQRTLDYAVSGEVRNQDSWQLLASLLRNPVSRAQAWDYVQRNWDKVHAQLTASSGQRIVASTGAFCTVEQRDQAQAFFAAHPVENTERSLKQAYEASTDCITLRGTQEPKLRDWLERHQ